MLGPCDHAVQFYGLDEPALIANAGAYLLDGLRKDDNVIVVAQPRSRTAFESYLGDQGVDHHGLQASGRLQVIDSEQTLDRFMVGGQPDSRRFNDVIGSLVRGALAPASGLRAYGDMVDLLWKRGQYPAAIRLEQLWHRLIADSSFSLFCGYEIDVLDPDLELGLLDALLRAHSHLLPGGAAAALSTALGLAMKEAFGEEFERVAGEASGFSQRGWSRLAPSEATILFLRKDRPAHARRVLARAREHYLALRDSQQPFETAV
ncbi:MAG TPA: MEDS domain-containing protein [Candidatus Baltobacteraceae bacterium]